MQGLDSQQLSTGEDTMSEESFHTFETQPASSEQGPESTSEKQPRRRKKQHRRGNGQQKRNRRGQRSGKEREPFRDLEALEAEDEFFGNQKDYVPLGGNGVDGYYREPMSNGSGSYSRYQQQQYYQQQQLQADAQGVLSIRLPGWQERISKSESEQMLHEQGILTMRQQPQQRSSNQQGKGGHRGHGRRKNQSRSGEQNWNRSSDDSRRGKSKNDGNQKRRRRKNRRRPQQNNSNNSE